MWDWLTKTAYSKGFVGRVLLKAALLFVLINGLYLLVNPLPALSTFTLYNTLLPGRERLPYSDDPAQTYSLTLNSIEAMFASHEINSVIAADDVFRVVLIGDSSVWGWLLPVDKTLSACLNRDEYMTADGRRVVAHNLGYPALSAVKDALILEEALRYEPDAVLWLVTLQTLLDNEQLRHPILQNNRERTLRFVTDYDLPLDVGALPDAPTILERTLIGQRRDLADLLRHQVYGLAWWMTNKDHALVAYIGAPVANLNDSENLLNRDAVADLDDIIMWEVLRAGQMVAGDVPVLVVNTPIFISNGLNSDVRYNEYYPRWAYDAYRARLPEFAGHMLDLWDAVPAAQFTDTPFHYDAAATCAVAERLAPAILDLAN